jgi:hypothetical protein
VVSSLPAEEASRLTVTKAGESFNSMKGYYQAKQRLLKDPVRTTKA